MNLRAFKKQTKGEEVSFGTLFFLFALLYFFLFYAIPLLLILINMGGVYAYQNFNFSYDEILIGVFFGILFLVSFSFAHFLFFKRSKKIKYRNIVINDKRKLLLTSALYLIFYTIYFLAFTDIDRIYAERQGELKGSHLIFFINIIASIFGFFLVLKLDEHNYKKYALLMLLVIFFTGLFGGAGRYSLLISLGMIILLLFKIKISRIWIALAFFAFISLLPIIINLKSIIYIIGTQGYSANINFYDFYDFYDLSLNYLKNFGHPAISLMLVDLIIDQIGYRFFYDYIQGFLFFFRLFGFDIGDSLTYFNTYAILGVRESIIPPGYVAFGFVQAHFLGVIVSGVFFAFLGYVCNAVRVRVFPESNLAKYYFALTAANTFYHGEMRLIVMTVIFSLALMLLLNKYIK